MVAACGAYHMVVRAMDQLLITVSVATYDEGARVAYVHNVLEDCLLLILCGRLIDTTAHPDRPVTQAKEVVEGPASVAASRRYHWFLFAGGSLAEDSSATFNGGSRSGMVDPQGSLSVPELGERKNDDVLLARAMGYSSENRETMNERLPNRGRSAGKRRD